MKDSVTEADWLKLAETGELSTLNGGGRPIRKRGYHRALKRGEPWAVSENSFRVLRSRMYREHIESLMNPGPLMRIIGLKEIVGE